MIYTYKYDPTKSTEWNAEESMKMDKLRATMGRNSDKLRKTPEQLNGHKPLKDLDNRSLIC